jgi:glycolate oxidase
LSGVGGAVSVWRATGRLGDVARGALAEPVASLEPGIRTAVVDIVGGDHVSFEPAIRRRYGCGLSDLFSAVPDVVVFPASTGEVSELIRGAHACGVPIAHRRAAASPAGAVLLAAGGIILSLERMNRIIDIALDDGIARVQPHVTAAQLRSATGFAQLELPVFPADAVSDQLASGGRILGVEAVLPTGEIVRTGGSLLAQDLGERDAATLLAGPDGTLAVITELTVALDPARVHPYMAVASFTSVAAACAAARTVMTSERTPPHPTFLDRPTISSIEDRARLGLRRSAPAMLVFAGVDRTGECRDLLYGICRICADAGAIDARVAEDPAWCAKLQRTLAQTGLDKRLGRALPPGAGAFAVPVAHDQATSETWFGR